MGSECLYHLAQQPLLVDHERRLDVWMVNFNTVQYMIPWWNFFQIVEYVLWLSVYWISGLYYKLEDTSSRLMFQPWYFWYFSVGLLSFAALHHLTWDLNTSLIDLNNVHLFIWTLLQNSGNNFKKSLNLGVKNYFYYNTV